MPGSSSDIGKIIIEEQPLSPGLALNKNLPKIGNMSIRSIVNTCEDFQFLVLQNTRLSLVMNLADTISKGVYHFSFRISNLRNLNNKNIL